MALAGSTFVVPGAVLAAPAPAQISVAPTQGSHFASKAVFGALVVSVAATQRRKRTVRAAGPLALPWAEEPGYRKLNDPLAAEIDAGFDPLDLGAKNNGDNYYAYREAEQKHGRLAMLATVGWLTAEEFQGAIARQLGLKDDLAPGELAPSLLNGGLGNLPPWFLPGIFAITAFIEISAGEANKSENAFKYDRARVPGDLKWDPLGLRAKLEGDGYTFSRLHNAEVKHGRAAMIAITAFAFQEYFFKIPVVIEDEVASDRVVKILDKAIDNVDKAAGLSIPDIPLPFPNL